MMTLLGCMALGEEEEKVGERETGESGVRPPIVPTYIIAEFFPNCLSRQGRTNEASLRDMPSTAIPGHIFWLFLDHLCMSFLLLLRPTFSPQSHFPPSSFPATTAADFLPSFPF